MEYRDFELHVTADHQIHCASDEGEVYARLEFDATSMRLGVSAVQNGAGGTKLLTGVGAQLYRALFPPAVHAHLRATIAGAGNCGVRIRLILDPPDLAGIPWEFLYDPESQTYLAVSPMTVLSRYIPQPLPIRDVRQRGHGPVRVLVVISSPRGLDDVNAADEERLIRSALAERVKAGQVEVDVLRRATVGEIGAWLREKPYAVFHYIGHANFDGEQGVVALVDDETGGPRYVTDETFAGFFIGNRTLGLAVLNTCSGAAIAAAPALPSPTTQHRALVGVAPRIVERGVPAVVAMRYPVDDRVAAVFADTFYSTLTLGRPVDETVQETRKELGMQVGFARRDFVSPVLFMRARHGAIFA